MAASRAAVLGRAPRGKIVRWEKLPAIAPRKIGAGLHYPLYSHDIAGLFTSGTYLAQSSSTTPKPTTNVPHETPQSHRPTVGGWSLRGRRSPSLHRRAPDRETLAPSPALLTRPEARRDGSLSTGQFAPQQTLLQRLRPEQVARFALQHRRERIGFGRVVQICEPTIAGSGDWVVVMGTREFQFLSVPRAIRRAHRRTRCVPTSDGRGRPDRDAD